MNNSKKYTRRHFLQDIALGGGGLVVLGTFGFRILKDNKNHLIKAISINFEKCAGCRTCETACSAFNHPITINGEKMNGLGNPHLSNIKVYHFNPDIDIPTTCAICPDSPCINACPVSHDLITGRKALYRDENLTIKNDLDRCIGCMQCAKACEDLRGGVIHPNSETDRPQGMCTLCDGNPQCVQNCPFGALEYIEMPADRDLVNLAPAKIAEKLINELYNLNV